MWPSRYREVNLEVGDSRILGECAAACCAVLPKKIWHNGVKRYYDSSSKPNCRMARRAAKE
jgi:hypothetical protein